MAYELPCSCGPIWGKHTVNIYNVYRNALQHSLPGMRRQGVLAQAHSTGIYWSNSWLTLHPHCTRRQDQSLFRRINHKVKKHFRVDEGPAQHCLIQDIQSCDDSWRKKRQTFWGTSRCNCLRRLNLTSSAPQRIEELRVERRREYQYPQMSWWSVFLIRTSSHSFTKTRTR